MVWGGVDVLRGIFDVVKWPFERAVWAIERGFVWPLEERTGDWNGPLRAAGVAALALLAVGAGVLGLLWASGSGGGSTAQTQQASAPPVLPIVKQAPKEELAQAAPVLQGAAPKFVAPATEGDTPKAGSDGGGKSVEAEATHAPTSVEDPSLSTTASSTAVTAGPAATKIAHQFATAFVLYETGQSDAKVRQAFATTATPQLTHTLLRRPPRLPANVEVPKAKVLNIVPGPKQGDTYLLSVSLLRLGVTSELRLYMQHDKKSAEWLVTDVRG